MERLSLRIAAVLITTVTLSTTFADGPKPEELDWLKTNAIALTTCEAGHGFDDLQPLKGLIGDARIVSLGECTHGTREVFQMKHRLVEYLATLRGFTIFSIEANMPEAYRLNEYVLEGKGEPKQLIGGMYFWTWNTEEVLAMVQWMRKFNQSGKGHIEFTGFDMQTPDVAMDIVLDFLKKADPQRVKAVEQTYNPLRNGKFNKAAGQGGGGFAVATGTFPLAAARGKKIRYSGWIKTQGVTNGFAGLWWRADGKSGVLAFDNMESRAIHGDTDWTEQALALEIPEETININFGALLSGEGKAWFDDLQVEIDGKPFDTAGKFDFNFEGETPKGFFTAGQGYVIRIDEQVAKKGKSSLRMDFAGSAKKNGEEEGPDPAAASKACGALLTQMEGNRDKYIKATSAKETDWAIQNARVVHQCLKLAAQEVSRDESMARNVKWILDQSPKDSKLVLWAHNGHVARQKYPGGSAMGGYLDDWYGKQQVVLGFSAGEGQYTAILPKKGLRSDNQLKPPDSDSFEYYFHAAGLSAFILDLRKATSGNPSSAWLTQSHSLRSIGALVTDMQFGPAEICKLYDAIIYLDKTTASRPLINSKQKK